MAIFQKCLIKVDLIEGFILLGRLLYDLFTQVGTYLKTLCCELHYIIDSFPVAL